MIPVASTRTLEYISIPRRLPNEFQTFYEGGSFTERWSCLYTVFTNSNGLHSSGVDNTDTVLFILHTISCLAHDFKLYITEFRMKRGGGARGERAGKSVVPKPTILWGVANTTQCSSTYLLHFRASDLQFEEDLAKRRVGLRANEAPRHLDGLKIELLLLY